MPTPIISGEPVFAPDPDGTAEDDGWLLNLATDHQLGKSELIVHDAHDLEIVARVQLPHRVPSGFHGNWMPPYLNPLGVRHPRGFTFEHARQARSARSPGTAGYCGARSSMACSTSTPKGSTANVGVVTPLST